jgi:hypothetical protein
MAESLKAVLSAVLPPSQKLAGQRNWLSWRTSIDLFFEVVGLKIYFTTKEAYDKIPAEKKPIALLIIRNNLSEEVLSLVFTETDPFEVITILNTTYEGSGPVLRQQLYQQFHQIKVEDYASVAIFIAKFQDLYKRLTNTGSKIEEVDKITIFIGALTKKFPIWAERQRSRIRNRENVTIIGLIEDILDERHTNNTIKAHDNHRATYNSKSASKDVIMQDVFYNNKKPFFRNNNKAKPY